MMLVAIAVPTVVAKGVMFKVNISEEHGLKMIKNNTFEYAKRYQHRVENTTEYKNASHYNLLGEKIKERVRNENLENVRERVREILNKHRMYIQEEKNLTEKFKNDIKTYRELRQLALKLGLRSKEGFEYAKLYIVHGLLSVEDFLNLVKVNVISLNLSNDTKEEVLSEINGIIYNLQKRIENVNNTTSPEELRKAVKEVREYWISVKPKIRIYGELFVVSKFYDIAERAEMIGMNIQANATENVEVLLDEYFEHVDKAKELLEEAKGKIVRGEDAMEEIREARKELIQAFVTLRDIYKSLGIEKLRELQLGNETGQLWAEIEGNLSVSGQVVVVLNGNGTVDVNEESVVTVVGFGKVGESNGKVTYEGKGLIVAKGDVNLSAKGEFKMFVKGRGVVYLEGKGEYRIKPLPEEEMVHSELRGNETLMVGEL